MLLNGMRMKGLRRNDDAMKNKSWYSYLRFTILDLRCINSGLFIFY
jgi:hypothetical protein